MCDCNFCIDYKWLNEVLLPQVKEEDKLRLEQFFEGAWNLQEEYSYKKSILDGSWPDSVELLKLYLHRAEAKQAAAVCATLAQVASAESDLNFDCKVCDRCNKPMTAKEYWDHKCDQVGLVTESHACYVVDISDGPCGDPSHDEHVGPSVLKPHQGPCDKCHEGVMVERKNSKTGNTFLGCSEFPECKNTESGGSNPQPESADHNYDYDYCADDDDVFMGGDHLGDFF